MIKDAKTNKKADMLYRQCVQAFDRGDFEQALTHLSDAIALRNDTLNPSFKRLMAMKLRKLTSSQVQKSVPVRQFIWDEAEKVIVAEALIKESAEKMQADRPLPANFESSGYPTEHQAEELTVSTQGRDASETEMLITRHEFEEKLPATQTIGNAASLASEKLEEMINSLASELHQQTEETAHLKEALKLLGEGESNRNFESKRAIKYWSELNRQIGELEGDIAQWKKTIIIGGIVFCVVITILLFFVFRY